MVKKSSVPALLFGGLTAMTAVATGWFGVETYLLATGKRPITWYVRNEASWHPGWTAVVLALAGFAVGAGATHFAWDETQNP